LAGDIGQDPNRSLGVLAKGGKGFEGAGAGGAPAHFTGRLHFWLFKKVVGERVAWEGPFFCVNLAIGRSGPWLGAQTLKTLPHGTGVGAHRIPPRVGFPGGRVLHRGCPERTGGGDLGGSKVGVSVGGREKRTDKNRARGVVRQPPSRGGGEKGKKNNLWGGEFSRSPKGR